MAKKVRSGKKRRMKQPRKKWMECEGKKSVGADRGSTRTIRGRKKGMGREKLGWGNSNFTIVKILETVLKYAPYNYGTSRSVVITGF